MDVSKLAALGWRASTTLEHGLRRAYESALDERLFDPQYSATQRLRDVAPA
jgi:hypothetical protein